MEVVVLFDPTADDFREWLGQHLRETGGLAHISRSATTSVRTTKVGEAITGGYSAALS